MAEPSRKLSSEEVNALMEGLKSGDLSASTTIKDGKEVEFKTFQFGSDDLSLLGDYYALRLINERFARTVRSVFLPLLRVQPRISSFPPEVKSYEEYSSGLDAFMSMTNSRIDELRGSMLTVLPPNFVNLCTSSRYGGKLEVSETNRTEFTSTEEKIIEVVNEGIAKVLEQSWKDLTPITIKFHSREQNPQFAAFVESSDLIIVCSFVMQLPKVDSMSFDIVYPLQTLKPVSSLLRSRVQSDVVESSLSWRDKLEKAVLEVPLKVQSNLSEPVVSMSKLLRIKEGDTLNINVDDTVDFYVSNQKYFKAEMGEVKGNASVKLTKRLKTKEKKMNAETAQEEKKETPTEEVKENTPEEAKVEGEDKTNSDQKDKVAKQGSAAVNNLRVLENIEVRLTVEVGNTEIKIKDLLRLNEGSVVELERLAGEPLDILANGTKIAKGEVVMVGEKFGIRFTEVADPEELIRKSLVPFI